MTQMLPQVISYIQYSYVYTCVGKVTITVSKLACNSKRERDCVYETIITKQRVFKHQHWAN